jgi:DNA repair exonuclease SbcCD ATPase subunit
MEYIVNTPDEILKLKDRVNELEGQLKDVKKEYDDLNMYYINRGSRIECLELDLKDYKDRVNKYEKLFKHACDMTDYWYSTYYEAVRQGRSRGVSIRINKANLIDNVGIVQVKNERAEELEKENQALKERNKELEKKAEGVIFMYNITVTYSDEDDVGIFKNVTNWTFTDDFLMLHWMPDTTTFISKKSIRRMTIKEVKKE